MDDYDISGVDWADLSYTMTFGGFRYSQIRHLCYIDETGYALTSNSWSPVVKRKQRLHIEAREDSPVRAIELSDEVDPHVMIN